ncbi:kup [Wigglesworthia glossinidia endosymbiont of Glossina brevipalpis]|uniref:Low affinity potassium transport system protein Kup n=1 Tax=Wigglesworthia glossinidia brevipalpis TaxID=36870 RepID=KUP_WIGBR|nr:RecName: Full=Low affinity potassium transport system protein Kup; AltName: Full=Kup system potassium uptake protein [Wigglesworthia glossinidia endosymbiont of Glossina brevipalpis]BAC24754.1 kup [Wigglesworthia glossinidia endosymbiont of Glossina brevipalpis]
MNMIKKNKKKSFLCTIFSTINVLHGLIAISPIYIIKESFVNNLGFKIDKLAIFGILSIIFWTLFFIIFLKYLILIVSINNSGEGGILTLMSITAKKINSKSTFVIVILGLISMCLFFGDIIIIPSISIISVIEEISIYYLSFEKFIFIISIAIFTFLFFIQKKIKNEFNNIFSFLISIWFILVGLIGLKGIYINPEILLAINPKYLINFFKHYKLNAFFVFGTLILLISISEILYINIGRFSKLEIRKSWLFFVFPMIMINCFGQGSIILLYPESISHPFFFLVPDWARFFTFTFAIIISIISSQNIISSIFYLTRQAVRLGYLPNIKIFYTSEVKSRRIYIPCINWIFYLSAVIQISIFKNLHNLILIYGIGSIITMSLTTFFSLLFFKKKFEKFKILKITFLLTILILEFFIFISNSYKIICGGWFPIVFGIIFFTIMITWKVETFNLLLHTHNNSNSIKLFIKNLRKNNLLKVNGTSVFMSSMDNTIPLSIIHNIKHNKVLHEKIIFLNIKTEDSPFIKKECRVEIEKLNNGFWGVKAYYGFKETPDIKEIFHFCNLLGISLNIMETSFFISHESLILGKRPWYLAIRAKLFIFLKRNSLGSTYQYSIPLDRVIALGIQVKI